MKFQKSIEAFFLAPFPFSHSPAASPKSNPPFPKLKINEKSKNKKKEIVVEDGNKLTKNN